MLQTKLSQKGFAPLQVVLAIIVIAIIGGTGYFVYNANKKASDTLNTATKASQSSVPKTHKSNPKSATPATPASAAYTADAPCQTAQLSLALAKDLGSVMNQPAVYFSLTNTSKAACTVNGYPSLKLYTASNSLIPVTVKNSGAYQNNDPGAGVVTVAPASKVYFSLGWSALSPSNNELAGGCMNASTVEAMLPGTSSTLKTNAALKSICGNTVFVTAIATASAFTTSHPE